jgi:hypothetical protein
MIYLKCDLCGFTQEFDSSDDFTACFHPRDIFGMPRPAWGPFHIRSTGVSMHTCPDCRTKAQEIMFEHEKAAVAEIEATLKKADLSVVQ